MTADANPLTERAKNAPTVESGDLRALLDALDRLGYDSGALFSGLGLALDRQALVDPDARVPCWAHPALIGAAQAERFTPNLMLRLTEFVPIGSSALLDYLVVTCETVGAGLVQLGRYLRLAGSPVVLEIEERGDLVELRLLAGDPPGIEYTIALVMHHMREETQGRFAAERVSFVHRPDDSSEHERVFGCPVRVLAAVNSIELTRAVWELPMRRGDSVLRGVLERQADEAMASEGSGTGTAAAVRRVLTTVRLARGEIRISGVARELAISARTLQRQLAAEGVSYQSVLDDVRREAAGRHVARSTLSISEVAYLLGYSEPAPFHRAFRRWYGVTPQAFRKR